MKIIYFLLLLPLLFSCKKSDYTSEPTAQQNVNAREAKFNNSGHIKIAVLSDIHYMHPSLLQGNAENEQPFKTYLNANPNKGMQQYSAPIFDEVLAELKNEAPDLLLISGDLSKNGEKIDHETVSSMLQSLQGTKIYVVPGNNDINSFGDVATVSGALAFNGSSVTPVSTITPAEFTSLYANYGYTNTIRDPNSLSYMAKPYPDVWILGIDAVQYIPKAGSTGLIKPATMQWIKGQMELARQSNAMVIGLIHHNMIEHFKNQISTMPRSVLNNWEATVDSLMNWGLKISIAGHNHSTDVTEYFHNGHSFYEIETGSLVTAPSAYRILTLKNKELEIQTNHVTKIAASLPGNRSFTDYSNYSLSKLLDGYFYNLLQGTVYHLTPELAAKAAPLVGNAYMAHMAGDEWISPEERLKVDSLNQYLPTTQVALNAINNLWTDLGVKDLKWHIKLTNP